MNLRNTIVFILILAIIGVTAYSAMSGVDLGKIKIQTAREKVGLGLDLAGGVYVLLEAQTNETGAELDKKVDQAMTIIRQRVDSLGVAEPNIVREGNKRIRVELAGLKDTQQAIDMIGKTAQLQFIDTEGNIVVTGKNVKKSEVAFQQVSTGVEEPVVSLEFDKEGASSFAEATSRLASKTNDQDKIIFIVLDDKVISNPVVRTTINDGKAVIEGGFDVQSASELATLIRAGALPVELKEVQTSIIGPTLGLESLDRSIYAGAIGLALIFLFMIIIYRVPGFIADISLTIYVLIVLGIMIALGVKLTLPGIAGLILSIGMAVDANIVIFERIKEELRVGKTIRTAVDSGFKRALSSVLDANVTTLIAGLVLYYFGSGPIKGFGVTLIIGIISSMITAVFITKFLLKLFIGTNLVKNTKLYGA
ncbi:protein translocase subunit SecD [Proteiniborus sp.]|uniref:protein translocase subunit SecD n=1 Tax=Proteiniborus sp. TaxID=2079015 RepID=UPI0033203077